LGRAAGANCGAADPPGMPSFSTDELPASERFAHWREERARNIFGVTIELDRDQHAQFNGRFLALPVGGAALVEMHASAYKVWRTDADIARSPSDSLCIYQQLDGGGWFDAGGVDFVVSAGSLATSHSDLPYATAPTGDKGFHLRLLKIPFARCKALIEREQDLSARPLQVEPGLTALFAAYFESFVAQAPHLNGAGAEAAVQTLAQLAIVARGLAAPRDERSRDAIRIGFLQRARQTIESNIHRPDLSPAVVAVLLGISVRQLHLLFEPTGGTYTRYVLARRLEHARLLLMQFPKRPVADIAFGCGFDSLSTFYRRFRVAFGMSPAEFRESAK
jgi:AraC-like DNA-binding protein